MEPWHGGRRRQPGQGPDLARRRHTQRWQRWLQQYAREQYPVRYPRECAERRRWLQRAARRLLARGLCDTAREAETEAARRCGEEAPALHERYLRRLRTLRHELAARTRNEAYEGSDSSDDDAWTRDRDLEDFVVADDTTIELDEPVAKRPRRGEHEDLDVPLATRRARRVPRGTASVDANRERGFWKAAMFRELPD